MQNLFSLGWSNIRAHKLRSSLAILMITVGIGTVIAIVTVAAGTRQTLLNSLAEFYRADVIYMKGALTEEKLSFEIPRVFSERDAQRIAQLKDVKAVGLAGQLEGAALSYNGQPLPVNRVMASFSLSEFFPLEQGRFPQAKGEVVLSSFLVETLRQKSNSDRILGQTLTLKYLEDGRIVEDQLQVVGFFKQVPVSADQLGLSGVNENDTYVSIDYLAPNRLVRGEKVRFVEEMFIRVEAVQQLQVVKEAVTQQLFKDPSSDFKWLLDTKVEEILRQKRLAPGEGFSPGISFSIRLQADAAKAIEEAVFRVAGFVSSIGIFALLVGMLGITAIMVINVTERTREIGVLRAIGASRLAILRLFLIEAVILCTAGAVIGIGFGTASSFLVKGLMKLFLESALDVPLVFLPDWYAIALLGGIIVGLLGGLYPAWQAARVNPIEALRYE